MRWIKWRQIYTYKPLIIVMDTTDVDAVINVRRSATSASRRYGCKFSVNKHKKGLKITRHAQEGQGVSGVGSTVDEPQESLSVVGR